MHQGGIGEVWEQNVFRGLALPRRTGGGRGFTLPRRKGGGLVLARRTAGLVPKRRAPSPICTSCSKAGNFSQTL